MSSATWYFDFVSPFAYIGLHRLGELPAGLAIEYRPVLFAGLLDHWGQKGPAELPTKRRYTYRFSQWTAARLGLRFRYPAAHPFNPLPHLRLALACDSAPQAVQRIFDSIWTGGHDAADPGRYRALCEALGVGPQKPETAQIKDALKKNTQEAAQRGVFGVPMLDLDGELFWGADAIDFFKAYLADRATLENDEVRRLDGLPQGAVRKGS